MITSHSNFSGVVAMVRTFRGLNFNVGLSTNLDLGIEVRLCRRVRGGRKRRDISGKKKKSGVRYAVCGGGGEIMGFARLSKEDARSEEPVEYWRVGKLGR
jgi:hypothetical protein